MTATGGVETHRPTSADADLRSVMRLFPTGVAVLSTGRGEDAVAMTVNSFTSVSLEPPRVLVSVMKAARAHPVATETGRFSIHLLSDGQRQTAGLFASRDKPTGRSLSDALDPWGEGCDVLPGSLASLDCEVEAGYPGGDHTLFLARVVRTLPGESGQGALLFHHGRLTSVSGA